MLKLFLHEILLNSGQYALFYLLMQLTVNIWAFFLDLGHLSLTVALVLQTWMLVRWGNIPWLRFALSLLAPLVYTLVEIVLNEKIQDWSGFVLQGEHLFFWLYSLVTGALQGIMLSLSDRHRWHKYLEGMLVFFNVSIFLFIYFIFDTLITATERYQSQQITMAEWQDATIIFLLPQQFRLFIADPTHIYVLAGGFLMAMTLAYSRFLLVHLKERLRRMFGALVGDEIAQNLLDNPRALSGEKRQVTLLFADIRGFTTISEQYSPEVVLSWLNRYFSVWESVVAKHGGVINKFIGDAVMVVFGAPLNLANHADHALECSREILAELAMLNLRLIAEGWPSFKIGIGIHSGPVLAGSVGGRERFEYSVIGDTVNVASRIEALTKHYQTSILVSEATYQRLQRADFLEHVGEVELRGRSQKIELYRFSEILLAVEA